MSNFSQVSTVVDFSQGRYATDSGPQCSKKCCPAGETLWVYLVQYPYANAIGQCACCHDVVNVALPNSVKNSDTDTARNNVTIAMIKAAHFAVVPLSDEERVFAAIAKFPKRFGLRGFPGDVFRCSATDSYVNDDGIVTIYLERLSPQRESFWLAHSKGTEVEIQREIIAR